MTSPNKTGSPAGALAGALLVLLRPLVRLLLRYGIPYGAFADLAKRVYVEVAEREFVIPGRKQTVSRISVITGLTRKEVRRLLAMEPPDNAEELQRYNRAARVISGWVRDPRFRDRAGRPAALPIEGPSPNFADLVREYSGDIPARAILDELVRVGAVESLKDGRVRLRARAYVPAAGEADKLAILGTDVADLISCIDHNLKCPPEEAFFQRKVAYDNLPREATAELRRLAAERAQSLLEELDRWMAARDRDTNPGVQGTGRKRASLGIYYYEEDVPEEESEQAHE